MHGDSWNTDKYSKIRLITTDSIYMHDNYLVKTCLYRALHYDNTIECILAVHNALLLSYVKEKTMLCKSS